MAHQSLTNLQNVTKEMTEANKNIQSVADGVQKEVAHNSQELTNTYQNSVKQLITQSLTNFQSISHGLEESLQQKIKDFHDTLLPKLEQEVEAYKDARMKDVDRKVNTIIEKVSQKALHKAMPMEDHKNLIIESFEKAKKEGVFD